jgi:hypothetical protein
LPFSLYLLANQTGNAIAIQKKFLHLQHYHPLSQQRLLGRRAPFGARYFFIRI